MEHQITLDGKAIIYTTRISMRARRLRITLSRGGSLVVTIPKKGNEQMAKLFVIEKSAWVLRVLEKYSQHTVPVAPSYSQAEIELQKIQAKTLVTEKIKKFNSVYQFAFGKVTIKQQKTLWGSCSKRGNLSFNYGILFLPERLAEYIVVHELCHLSEFNHGQAFWNLVARTIPEYVTLRNELKKNSLR